MLIGIWVANRLPKSSRSSILATVYFAVVYIWFRSAARWLTAAAIVVATAAIAGPSWQQIGGWIAVLFRTLALLVPSTRIAWGVLGIAISFALLALGTMLSLRKANTKHEYADLELMVDDFKLSKKHVNIYEPVMFYNADNGRPVELVINSVGKNHIHGYVSEPKYKSSDLDAMANSASSGSMPANAGSGDSSSTPRAGARQRLELPRSNSPN